MRMESPTMIYSANTFTKQHTPISGNYNLPDVYRGGSLFSGKDSKASNLSTLKNTIYDAGSKIKNMYSTMLDKVKDSYQALKPDPLESMLALNYR